MSTVTVYERELAEDIQTELGLFSAGTPVTVTARRNKAGTRTIVLGGHLHTVDAAVLRAPRAAVRERPTELGGKLRVTQTVLADLYTNATPAAQKRTEAKLGPRVLDWCVAMADRRAP